jgi:ferrous iron transport protein B
MTHCSVSVPELSSELKQRRIAVLGMPNTGKSTFFNRLTRSQASVGNWPGITVELMMAQVAFEHLKFEALAAQVVDLPGIYDLRGFSEDEAVVQRFLETTPVSMLVVILNATQLDRQITLALQAKQLAVPMVLLLNMADEAPKFGVQLDVEGLTAALEMPVVPISAKYGQHFEAAELAIAKVLEETSGSQVIEDIETKLTAEIDPDLEARLAKLVKLPDHPVNQRTANLDRVLLHPVFGLPLFFGAMYLVFQVIYAVGTPLQEWMGLGLGWVRSAALEPLLVFLLGLGIWGKFVHGFLLDGLYEGIGTVTAFVPVIFLFFVCMAIVEDSGYLSRSAYLMDAFMERLGLDGRSFVMSLMGFGCNVPAIMGLRVMRSPGLRMLSMLVIPFSLCSARLNVFLFMTTVLFTPSQAPLVLFSLYMVSFAAAIFTALMFKGRFQSQEPLILELPPYRFPTVKQMVLRAWREVKHFMFWARKFIIFGVIAIWFCNNVPMNVAPASSGTLSGLIGQGLQPLLAPLGINSQLSVALLFGFIAKEIVLGGLAVIYSTSDNAGLGQALAGQIDWVQGYSFMLFTLLYVPCLSTIAVIKSESKSSKFAAFSVVWSLVLAWAASFVFYQGARFLGY